MDAQTAEQRRHRHRTDARRAILDASEALLVEGGCENFSIRRLASRCGFAAPTIYHYFVDKTNLIDALLEERFEQLLGVLGRVPSAGGPLETIRSRARAFVEFSLRHPTHYQLLAASWRGSAGPLRPAEQARAFVDRPWLELVERGQLTTSQMHLAQQAVWTLLHGLISLQTDRRDIEWRQTLVEDSIDALLRGLVAPAPPGPSEPA